MESNEILLIVLAAGGIVAAFFISKAMKTKKEPAKKECPASETELAERFTLGAYAEGLSGVEGPAPLVFCGVTDTCFVLRRGTRGAELGRIPRNAVRGIELTQQGNNQRLSIGWQDTQGVCHTVQFAFGGKNAGDLAEAASTNVKSWLLEAAPCKTSNT